MIALRVLPLRPRIAFAALSALVVLGCDDPTLPKNEGIFQVIEKGPYQSLYAHDGKIERLLHDRNADGVADAVILYGSEGRLRRAEIDTNLDKIVDRWEHFENGVMVGVTVDIDGDGRPDRREAVASQK